MIVPAVHRTLAQSLCAAIAGPAGSAMFLRPLYKHPEPPPAQEDEGEGGAGYEPQEPELVAYISSGRVDAEFASLLPLDGEGGNPEAIAGLAQQAGVQVDPSEITELLNEADITDIDPHDRIAQLGLVLG